MEKGRLKMEEGKEKTEEDGGRVEGEVRTMQEGGKEVR